MRVLTGHFAGEGGPMDVFALGLDVNEVLPRGHWEEAHVGDSALLRLLGVQFAGTVNVDTDVTW